VLGLPVDSQTGRERGVVSAWIDQLKSQGSLTAPGDLGMYLSFHWETERCRQLALNQPAVAVAHATSSAATPRWFPPALAESANIAPRCKLGPIGLAIDLHAAWHDKVFEAAGILRNMGASILIPRGSGEPYIALGKRLASNYTIPRRPAAKQPPAEASPSENKSISHAEQAHRRQAEHQLPAAQSRDDHYGPAQGIACQGCDRIGHTPDTCLFQSHPNWNARHRIFDFHDTDAGRAMMREGAGTQLVGITSHEVV
jgi:hypothetical protein